MSGEERLVYRGASEIGRALGLKESTCLKRLQNGKIPGLKIGGTWVVGKKALEEWLEKESLNNLKGANREKYSQNQSKG